MRGEGRTLCEQHAQQQPGLRSSRVATTSLITAQERRNRTFQEFLVEKRKVRQGMGGGKEGNTARGRGGRGVVY